MAVDLNVEFLLLSCLLNAPALPWMIWHHVTSKAWLGETCELLCSYMYLRTAKEMSSILELGYFKNVLKYMRAPKSHHGAPTRSRLMWNAVSLIALMIIKQEHWHWTLSIGNEAYKLIPRNDKRVATFSLHLLSSLLCSLIFAAGDTSEG